MHSRIKNPIWSGPIQVTRNPNFKNAQKDREFIFQQNNNKKQYKKKKQKKKKKNRLQRGGRPFNSCDN